MIREHKISAMAPSATEALLVVAIAMLVIALGRLCFKRQNLNLPPGPMSLPLIGCLHLIGTHPHQSMAALSQKYGPVMSLPLGQKFCIVASSPEAAEEFLKRQDANFSSRPPMLVQQIVTPFGLVFQQHDAVVRHLRKLLVTELTSAKRVEATKHVRAEEAASMLNSVAKNHQSPFKVRTLINITSTNMLSRMILGKRFLGGELYEFMEIVEEEALCLGTIPLQDIFTFVPAWVDPQGLTARFRRLKARMDVFYERMVEEFREDRRGRDCKEDEKTLLDVLLQQLDAQEGGITEKHVSGLVWDVISAGTDTTVVTGEWALAEVIHNPAVMKAAQLELDRVVGYNRTVQESDIPDLKYIQAIVKETMRLHAPGPLLVPHQSDSSTKAFGYDIPAKTRLFVNVWGIGRDPRIWERPLEFMPERFMSGEAGVDFQGHHYKLIPFGSGRRMCPGMGFGSVVLQLEVATLLHAFDWGLPGGAGAETMDMREGFGLTPPKRDPLVAVATPRLAARLYEC